MIALLILLVIAIGVLPLLVRALANNVRGWEATRVGNEAVSAFDLALQLPLNAPTLTLTAGDELVLTEYYARGELGDVGGPAIGNADEGWTTDPTDRGPVVWTRTFTVRQYGLDDVIGSGASTPLPAGTDENAVHLKEVEVAFRGTRQGGALGASGAATAGGDDFTIRMLKVQ